MRMHLVDAPLPGSYVVFLPVIAGPYPGAATRSEARRRVRRVLAEGCEVFVDLTEEKERLEPYVDLLPARTKHVRLPIAQGGVPPPERMREVVDTINRAAARDGRFVYVHDANGVGRVGMAVGCWLADLPTIDGDVLDFVDSLRSHIPERRPSPELPEQRAFVHGWTRGQQPAPLEEIVAKVRAAGGWVGTGADLEGWANGQTADGEAGMR